MAVVNPFRGVRYDGTHVADLADVLAPPYDVISPAQQEALYARSPYNVVRLILPRDADRGAAASETLRRWMAERVLAQDVEPALYFYSQRFTLPDGSAHTRDGILCRLGLEPFSTGVVRPHERTFPGPKADRLALLRATGAYLSPIFGMYARPGERLRDVAGVTGTPTISVTMPHGETHRMWRVTAPEAIARVQAALAAETIFIADGHHRYETALNYHAEGGGSGSILAFLSNMAEEGLVILPTHRLVKTPLKLAPAALEARLAESFAIEPLAAGAPRPPGVIDCVLPDRRLRLRPRDGVAEGLTDIPTSVRALDVAILHEAILRPILGVTPQDLAFTHDDAEAFEAVSSGAATAAFLLNPPTMAEVRAVCLAGELMPEKSTYFYPKLADGMVFDLVGPPWI
ncbi:MAG TPA: DUF1015 domain-containing protein [Candidatus Binatia bacterium]|jgi:uncharacterized protein (DUF1015 family)|nr:DUF1015 domain-containing protein [Candidatus Binatia bacterium]